MQINLEILEQMIQELADKNWTACDHLLPQNLAESLSTQCLDLYQQGQLKKAAIGVGPDKSVHQEIRGDFTTWIENDTESFVQKQLLLLLEELRNHLNRHLYLGLQRFEVHFAFYPTNTAYQKHIDNPRGQGHRRITFILYLNENWQPADGGLLALYSPQQPEQILTHIEPKLGRVVLFCSDIFPHEVLAANAPRKSVTGWFRNDAL